MKPNIDSPLIEAFCETGRLPFRVIDTHGHMGPLAGIYMPRESVDEMIGTMDRCGVERLVFSHHEALQVSRSGNRKAAEAIARYPDRLLGYLAVNPHYPDELRDTVDGLSADEGWVGFKILAGYYGTDVAQEACRPLWERSHEEELVVLLHTWGDDRCAGPAQVREIAKRYPRATILMGHSMFGLWDEAIALARDFDRVYCELTAAYAVPGVIDKMVAAGIAHKITFGTDLPWFDPMHGIGCVLFSHISDRDRRCILRDNALEMFERWM